MCRMQANNACEENFVLCRLMTPKEEGYTKGDMDGVKKDRSEEGNLSEDL